MSAQLTFPLSRISDPDTSHSGAEAVGPALNHLQSEVLGVLARWHNGATAHDVRGELRERFPNFEKGSIARRITDLIRLGLVEDTGERRKTTTASSRVYRVTESGRRAAA